MRAAEVSGARATARDADGAGTPSPHGGGQFAWGLPWEEKTTAAAGPPNQRTAK